MDQFSNNPFQPGVRQSVYVPDQLIAGQLQLVTDTVTIAKSGVLKRGAVLGQITASREYVLSKKGATDGSQTPCAILVDDVNTAESSASGGVYLMGEFNQHRITYDESWNLPELTTELRKFSIFLRDSVTA
ncbi:head decoration protein [Xenorhabdus anantnagensis]|uniref:Head decoration protein n=1 Tax=Xenorhabdus anantnagensis TaxID=3025875 RepID=A0ABT5LWP8_9GAMM|nr:head decoration protein [Xenorhabdus anantnagensis]MDC9598735.1 head decoration protein [Xenorhabdus anantnagensis]